MTINNNQASAAGSRRRHFFIAILLFVALAGLGVVPVLVKEMDRREDERRDLNSLGTVVASSLEQQLDRSLSSTFILASLVRQKEDRMIHDFDTVAGELIKTIGGIDNLQLAPAGIVSQIYPLEGNEPAIGHDLLNDPARRVESLKAIESGYLTLAGPFELVQGGTAVIGRLPVYVPGNQGEEVFWGFTIALIRLDNLLTATNLAVVAEQGHQYWLSRIHPDTGLRDVFAASIEGEIQDSVTHNIEVPNGTWALHLSNADDSSALWLMLEILLVGIFGAIVSILVYARLQRTTARKIAQQALDREINERRRLEAAELQLMKELSVVDELARVITSTLDIQDVYGEFAQQLEQLMDFDRVAIAVIDQDAGTFEYRYGYGLKVPGYDEGQVVSLNATRTQKILMTGQTLVMEDIAAQPEIQADPIFSNLGLRAGIHVPLVDRGQVFGVLNLRSIKVAAFGPREQAIIERLAKQIAPAVGNAELFEQSKRAEEAMRVSEGKYRTLMRQSPDMIFVSRIDDFRFTEVNDRACEHYGYSNQEFLTMKIFDIEIEPPLPEQVRSLYDSTPVGQVVEVYGTNKRKDGTAFPVHVRFAKLDDVLAIANVRDITDRKEAEESERRWAEETSVMAEIGRTVSASLDINQIYENLGEEIRNLIPFDRFSMSLVDQENETTSSLWAVAKEPMNREPADQIPLAGSLAGEVVRTKSSVMVETETDSELEHLFPSIPANIRDNLRSFMAVPLLDRDVVVGILRVGSKNLGVYTQRHLELFERMGNQIAGAIANSQLYAQQKDAEDKIRASLDEKEVLLKEINHRVKNNLQIISSLLNLQSRDIQDEAALRSFQVSQDRIGAMALVHEKLYQSEDLARIDFGEYIKSLATDLRRSYGLGLRHIELKIDVENILLGVDTAIPCGVIVNELVANSLKHAFPGDRSGEIAISFREADGQYTMVFKDNGVGLPDDLDISRPSSLGLTIVNALTGQLGGTIGLGGTGGSEISITFPATQSKGE